MSTILPPTLTLPPRVVTAPGAIRQLFAEARCHGARGLVVVSRSVARSAAGPIVSAGGSECGAIRVVEHAGGEPTLDHVETVLAEARAFAPDWIAAVGGGSVIDLAKAVCALVRAPLPVERYHDGEPLSAEVLPLIAVPTTAGTGSEATMVTVLINKRTGVKKSFRHPGMIPRSVILDAELLATCSPAVVAHAGMDALVQAVESYTSKGATWLTDVLALKAVELIAKSLEAVFEAPGNTVRAGELLTGSFLAGCALSNSRLGLVHGLAHPLGARYGAAHGLVCAVCMGPVLRFNREAIGAKHAELTAVLGESPEACFARLNGRLGIRAPFAGKPVVDRVRIIEETLASGSTAANPRPVAAGDVERLLGEIFQAGEAI